jgi:phage shock protein PspC (stress-responsive transcriptional regulator)
MTLMTNAPAEPPAPDQPEDPAGSTPPPGATPPPPGATPPPGAMPPPPGAYPPPVAPTGGYATRFHLVRPIRDRYLAGVCAALGRATNTDPVLWRVILPVLTLLNGLGAIIYLIGVLLIPSEGDTASPIEALAGRGKAQMRPATTIVVIALASVACLVGLNHVGRGIIIGVAVVGGIAVLAATRGGAPGTWPATWPSVRRADNGFTVNWPPSAPATEPMRSAPTMPTMPVPSAPVRSDEVEDLTHGDGEPVRLPETGWPDEPNAGDDLTDLTGEPVEAAVIPTYQEPFAPYGPYVASSAYPLGYPGLAPTTVVTPPPAPAAKVKVHSPIRRITISAALLVVGFLGLLDVTGVRAVSAPTYFAAALATIGIGMFVGSFFGRVRGPITLGVLLTIGLLVSTTADGLPRPYSAQTIRVAPTSLATLQSSYDQHYGSFTLDLSHLQLASTDHREVDITMKFGQVNVYLPPNVLAYVHAHVGAGDVNIEGDQHSGFDANASTYINAGSDTTGKLTIRISMSAGEAKVTS